MPITTRAAKGYALTHAEMDANLAAVQALVSGALIVVGTGVAATDYAAIVAAIAALPASGGSIKLTGVLNFGTLGPVVVNRPCLIFGDGSSDAYAATNLNTGINGTQPAVYANESEIAATTVYNTSQTASLFQVNAHGVTFRDIHFSNRAGSEPTAGSAIVLGGASGTPANGAIIIQCSFNRFWINIDVVNSTAYSIAFNKIIGHVKIGIRINNVENIDEGDPNIVNNWIMSGNNSGHPDAGILWESGGGPRIQGNKISRKGARAATDTVRHRKGIWIRPLAGSNSGVFVISGNSIEAIDEAAIFLDTATNVTGAIQNVLVTGNEFNMSSLATSGLLYNYVLWGKAGAGQVPGAVQFSNNLINGCYTMVRSEYFSGSIGPNTISGSLTGALIDIPNGPGLSYDISAQKLDFARSNVVLLSDQTADNYNSNSQRECINLSRRREFPAATIGTASNLFRILIGAGNCAAIIEVSFAGFLSGPGAYACAVKRVISGNGSAAAAATPTGWVDFTLAPNATTTTQQYLTWGFTNSGGYLTISATPTVGGTPALNTSFAGVVSGTVQIKVDGLVREFVVY